jgi:hypothetical protein
MGLQSKVLVSDSGECIPIRLFLSGFDLTPTYRDINMKFSARYYLNLVLIDEENRRYFKQQEVDMFYNRLQFIVLKRILKSLHILLVGLLLLDCPPLKEAENNKYEPFLLLVLVVFVANTKASHAATCISLLVNTILRTMNMCNKVRNTCNNRFTIV